MEDNKTAPAQAAPQKKEVRIVASAAPQQTPPAQKPVEKKKSVLNLTPKVGFANKSVHNVHVIFNDFDIVIPPHGRTTKIYYEKDVKSVQRLTLQAAIGQGMISVIR